MRMTIVPVVLLLACGGAQKGAGDADGSPCVEVAAHMVELANRDNEAEADEDLAVGMRGEFERQCREDSWSPGRRACLTAASTQEQTLQCPER
jgi:hypothetical protein